MVGVWSGPGAGVRFCYAGSAPASEEARGGVVHASRLRGTLSHFLTQRERNAEHMEHIPGQWQPLYLECSQTSEKGFFRPHT